MSIKMLLPSFARIGYIKIGDKGGKSGSPRKIDHFEIRSTETDAQGNLLPDHHMMARLGERPTSLKIRLPFNDIDMVFSSTLAYYRGRNRFCWGDGETAQRLTITQNGENPRFGPAAPYGPCGETCKDFIARRCKPLGTLQVILEEQQQIGGAYFFKTTSWNSIRNIMTALTAIKAQAGGLLAWVPLTMKLVPQVVQPKDGGSANTAYIVQIVFEGSPQQLLTTVRELLGTRAPLIQELRELEARLKALPPAEEDAGEAADTQEEFYPEMRDAGPSTGHDPKPASIERPTADHITRLIDLARQCGVDLPTFAQRVREWMRWPAEVKMNKKFLRESMTMQEYEEVWGIFAEQRARQQTQEEAQTIDQIEDDVGDFSGPDASISPHPDTQLVGETTETPQSEIVQPGGDDALIDDYPAADTSDATRSGPATTPAPESGEATSDVGKYATAQQIARLKTLAEQVGKDASADIQDMLDHHREGVALEVYRVVRERLLTRQAEQEKRAATKAGAQATTEA